MSKQNVADLVIEALYQAGVRRIYGVAGDSLNALTEALRSHGGMDWVHTRHEEVAAFAAGGEAHLTGSLAVCAGSCGPGNLHLINGLFDCHRSRVPVLAIAAQIPSAEIGRNYFQETHPQNLFQECSHFCEMVSTPEQMPGVLETAIRTAVGQRGVSVLVLPGDVAMLPLFNNDLSFNLSGHVLHTTFWNNLKPGGSKPAGALLEAMNEAFGSPEAFEKLFAATAAAVQGSGWAILGYNPVAGRLATVGVEKHNNSAIQGLAPLLVCDVWEHAYYLKYHNVRADYVKAFFTVVNYEDVAARLAEAAG